MDVPDALRQPASLAARVAELEQLLRSQQAHIARQDVTIAQLVSAQNTARETGESDDTPVVRLTAAPRALATAPKRASRRSRRSVLKLGGAAAAASVAAVAGAATELAHPDVAHATGVAWATGTVTPDVQTVVVPAANPTYTDPTILTVTLTTETPYVPLPNGNHAAVAVYDTMPLPPTPTYGLYATSIEGMAVSGHANTGVGVEGTTDSGAAGVQGIGNNSHGIVGSSGFKSGVVGISVSQPAVVGTSSTGYGGSFQGGQAPLWLAPSLTIGGPIGTHSVGELYVDHGGVLWYCTAGGTPGTWVRLTGVESGVGGGALNYLVTPIRLYDTRSFASAPLPNPKGIAQGGWYYIIQVTGTDVGGIGVPAGARGVFGNLTVTNAQGGGDLILFPHGAPAGTTSNINYVAGQTVANFFNVGLSGDGKMELYVHVSSTDVILDVAGYVM